MAQNLRARVAPVPVFGSIYPFWISLVHFSERVIMIPMMLENAFADISIRKPLSADLRQAACGHVSFQ